MTGEPSALPPRPGGRGSRRAWSGYPPRRRRAVSSTRQAVWGRKDFFGRPAISCPSSGPASGFDIEITGFCTSREVTQATFRFSAAPRKTLQTAEINLPIDALFSKWFQDPASSGFGSQFTFTQTFTVQGDANAVTPDSVTLTNRSGSVSAKVTP